MEGLDTTESVSSTLSALLMHNLTSVLAMDDTGGAKVCTTTASVCRPGVLLPVWQPAVGLTLGDTVARSLVYGLSLMYMFLGVSIIADRFMAAIEVITSQEKEIIITDSTGTKQIVMVRYWNETVSNLTVTYPNNSKFKPNIKCHKMRQSETTF